MLKVKTSKTKSKATIKSEESVKSESIIVNESISESINESTIVSELVSELISESEPIQKQKRGRKTKKEMEEIKKQKNTENVNINIVMDEINKVNLNEIISSNILVHESDSENDNNDNSILNENETEILKSNKKRGRKPKGGKIIKQILPIANNKETKPNIILHLKCSLKDLINNSSINSSIEAFDFSYCKSNDLTYEIINKKEKINNCNFINEVEVSKNSDDDMYDYENSSALVNNNNTNNNIKEIWKKLKQLEYNLHINNISNKKSSCFWCTCDFDNPPVYIPKHFIKDSYHVYGCFCSPECATAFLMDENIDSSIKFERYHLLNHIYAKIYNYTNNIKPAPNPFYLLDKYYGNLNIQEYRALLNNHRLFLIVDKPLTRILPELHEDNDDFIINNKIIPSNTYQIKKSIHKKNQSKNNIVNEKFGNIQQ